MVPNAIRHFCHLNQFKKGREDVRKVRSDKKRDVKPTMSMYVKENLYRLAYLCDSPVKDIGFELVKRGLRDDRILCEFQKLMISNFKMENHLYFGNPDRTPQKVLYRGSTGKVTIKFTNDVYNELRHLAFSIGLTPTSTASIMIRSTMFHRDFMNDMIRNYRFVGPKRSQELELFVLNIWKTTPK